MVPPSLPQLAQGARFFRCSLDKLLEYVEPNQENFYTYGHRFRDLLISACTELENFFQMYAGRIKSKRKADKFNFTDYAQLASALNLHHYRIEVLAHCESGALHPFFEWTNENSKLSWYRAYNLVKHHRDQNFHHANLKNCLDAVAALLIIYGIRFGPEWWDAKEHLKNLAP